MSTAGFAYNERGRFAELAAYERYMYGAFAGPRQVLYVFVCVCSVIETAKRDTCTKYYCNFIELVLLELLFVCTQLTSTRLGRVSSKCFKLIL